MHRSVLLLSGCNKQHVVVVVVVVVVVKEGSFISAQQIGVSADL